MKRIVASVGLVAAGASTLQAAVLPAMTSESGKPWALSATLRGFYDDNYNTIPNSTQLAPGQYRSSFGFEVSPGIQFNFPMEQTTLTFGYIYSLKYYDHPLINTDNNHIDQTHDINAALTHAFSERYSVSVVDSFAIGQEPDILRAGNTYTTFQKINGNNLRNYGSVDFMAQLTPEFGLDVGYGNTWYSYANKTGSPDPITGATIPNGSNSAIVSDAGLLNEIEQRFHVDGRYQLQPQTIGILGAAYSQADYTAGQPIFQNATTGQIQYSDSRNARSYYGYLGLDHNFRPDLTGSVRAGGYYTDYYNDPQNQNTASPYVMLSLQYTYLPESYLQFGGSYDYAPSSAYQPTPDGNLTLNSQAGTAFVTLRHRITPKLYGSLLAQFQDSAYYGGQINSANDQYYTVGLNLQYRFTPNFSTEIGYNYDKLDSHAFYFNSPVPGSYNRNRVYIGVTGSY